MKPKINHLSAVLLSLSCVFAACSDLEGTYEKYRGEGEYAYAGKLDKIRFNVGFNRVQLVGDLHYAKNAAQIVVEWNDRRKTVAIADVAKDGKCEFLIEELREGNTVFRIYTLDDAGKRSICEQIQIYVPGERFKSDQRVRTVDKFRLNAAHALEMEFGQSNRNIFETVYLRYPDSQGRERRERVSSAEFSKTIADFEKGAPMEVLWSIKPAPEAIDSLTQTRTLTMPAYRYEPVERSKFRDLRMATDAAMLNASYSVARLWDGNPATQAHTHANNGVPNHMTIDLGAEYVLRLGRAVMRSAPWDWAPYEFQIWGLPEVEPGRTVADYEPRTAEGAVMADNFANKDVWESEAEAKGWINLTQLNYARRSVIRTPLAATCDFYLYGEKSVRYVRFRTVKTLNKPDAAPSDGPSKQYACLAEIHFWITVED